MGSVTVEDALRAVVSAILIGVGTILLLYLWVVDVVIVQIGIRSGSFAIAVIYGGLPLLGLGTLTLTVLRRGASTALTRWGSRLRLAKFLWLYNAMNVLLTIPMAPALIFPPPSTTGTGPAYATSVLLDSVPDPWAGPKHDQYGGWAHFTASELNRIHWGAKFGRVTYVPANVPSTDPEIVSVNPIDNETWGAAAYSVRAQRCYVTLAVIDKSNYQYGQTFSGRLAPGAPCTGEAATPETATSTSVLPE